MSRSLHVATFLAAVALVVTRLAAPAAAQVGTVPARSPFVDLPSRQGLTPFAGYLFAASDRAGVAPQSAPYFGVQYDIYLGGPASFTARIASAVAERNVIDPARPTATRLLGVERQPLTMADAGFSFALTGQKSYRGFVPLVNGGIGVVSNFKGVDAGGFNLGTRFAFSYGGGVRYVTSGRLSVRGDVVWHLFQLRYPDRYFQAALDSTSVLPSGSSKSNWLNSPAVTVGLTYQIFR